MYVFFFSCFTLASFNISSLCLIFVSLLIHLCMSLYGTLCFLDLCGYFLPHFREVFAHNLLKCFLMPRPFVFWDSYNSNVWVLNVVPEVCETVLISFYSLFHSASVISTILSSSSFILFFCLIYSNVGCLQCIFYLNSGNSDKLYFGSLQNHCRWWLQP